MTSSRVDFPVLPYQLSSQASHQLFLSWGVGQIQLSFIQLNFPVRGILGEGPQLLNRARQLWYLVSTKLVYLLI